MTSNISGNPADDIEEVLLNEQSIARRIREMGEEISEDYRGRSLVLIGVLRGALVFLSDLSRAIDIPHSFDMVGASSYGTGTKSSGRVQITKDVEVALRGRDVLIVEDIYDSGRTLVAIRDLLRVHRPSSIRIAAFLYKQDVSFRAAEVTLDYYGFRIPNKFVVGYGLDYAEFYRHLPYIGVLSPAVYRNPSPTEAKSP